MDKKSLTPELKQVYDKVMSTPTRAPTQQTTPPAQNASTPLSLNTSPVMPSPVSPPNTNTTATLPSSPAAQSTSSMYSSVPPRTLKGPSNAAFVFSSSQKGTSSPNNDIKTTLKKVGGKSKALPVLIGFLVIIFIATYTVFWMVMFELIQLPI